jgi:hypothetical protein
MTPNHDQIDARMGSKPLAVKRSPRVSAALRSTPTNCRFGGRASPVAVSRPRFHAWVAGRSTSNRASLAIRSGRRQAKEFRPAPRSTYWSTPLATARATSSSANRERWPTNRRTTCAHECGTLAAKNSMTSAAERSASANANLSSKIGSRSTKAWAARNCAVMIAVRLAPSVADPSTAGPPCGTQSSAALPVKGERV